MVRSGRAPRRRGPGHESTPSAAGAAERVTGDARLGNQALVHLLTTPTTGDVAVRAALAGQGLALSRPGDAAERAAEQIGATTSTGGQSAKPRTGTSPPRADSAGRPALSGGDPLTPTARRSLEGAVGADLGGLRVHSGPAEAVVADRLGARAFTLGSSVVLGRGASANDLPLMAHEAAHVMGDTQVVVHRAPTQAPPVTSRLADVDHLRTALTPDQYAMLSDGAISRLAVPLVQLMDPEAIGYLERSDMLATVFPQLATYEGPVPEAEQLVTTIAQSETLRIFLSDKLRSPVTIVVDDAERPSVRFYLDDRPLPTTDGLITVGALNSVVIATTDAIAAHQYLAASQLIDIAMAQAKAEHATSTVLPLIVLIDQVPGDYALQEVQDLDHQCTQVAAYVESLSGALISDNTDLAPKVVASLELLTTVKKMAGQASAIVGEFARTHEPDTTSGETYADAEGEYADDAGLSLGGFLSGANWFATKVFHTIGNTVTAGHMDRQAANASAYRKGLISWNAYEENQKWNFGTSLLVAVVTALSAGLAGRAVAGLAGAGFTATGASVITGTVVGGATGMTGAMAADAGATIAARISGDRYVQDLQSSMVGGPLGWLEGGLAGAMLGGVFGRIFGGASRGPSDAYLEATKTAREAAGRTDVAATPPTAVTAETTGPVVYVNGEPVPPSHYGKVFHGDSMTPEEVVAHGGFKASGTNWDLVQHTEESGTATGGGGPSALRGATTLPLNAAQWGDWVYEVEGLPVWDTNKILQGKIKIAGMGEYRGALMHGEVEQSIPGEIPVKNITRFGRAVEVGKPGSGRMGVKQWFTWDTYLPRQ